MNVQNFIDCCNPENVDIILSSYVSVEINRRKINVDVLKHLTYLKIKKRKTICIFFFFVQNFEEYLGNFQIFFKRIKFQS